jgi:hypothetical protein
MNIKELKEGEIYSSLNDNGLYIFKCKKSKTTDYSYRVERNTFSKNDYFGLGGIIEKNIKLANEQEKHWLNECIRQDKFISYEESQKTFQKPFKFNIGDIVKTNRNGFECSKHTDKHKIISMSFGRNFIIKDRIFDIHNWYLLENHGNWITEEGIELVSEVKQEPKFIVGKWYNILYEYQGKNCNICFKVLKITKNFIDFFDGYYLDINKNYVSGNGIYISDINNLIIKEISISEIIQYLPDGHVDKVSIIPEYVECVNSWHKEWTTGKVYKVEKHQNEFPEKLTVKSDKNIECDVVDWDIRKGNDSGFKISTEQEYLKQNQPKPVDMKEIQAECEKRFPIGCTFINTEGDKFTLENDNSVYKIVDDMIYASYNQGCLYYEGRYAELVSLPKENSELPYNIELQKVINPFFGKICKNSQIIPVKIRKNITFETPKRTRLSIIKPQLLNI